MRWHIIGADGYIGSGLTKYIPNGVEQVCYSPFMLPGMVFLDLFHTDDMDLSSVQAGDFVVLLAAISSPDVCEKEFDKAYAINVLGTSTLIERLISKKANVLFFSSDVVNGATLPQSVDEHYEGTPIGRYGEMKRSIEKRFMGDEHFKVFRLSYVYSSEDKFSKYLDQCYAEGKTPKVFDALYRNAIYLGDIFDAVIRLSETFTQWGNTIFNLSGPQLLSRKDIASLYVRLKAPDMLLEITNPDIEFFKARPNIIATRSLYLPQLLGREPITLEAAMQKEYGIVGVKS